MVKKSLPAVYILIFIGVDRLWWTSLERLLLEMEALGVRVGVAKNEFPWRVVWWQRLKKEAPMKTLWVGKTFPIAPITTQTTALPNDLLPFPSLPPPPPLPPLPPVTPSPRAGDISSRRKIHAPGHGAPIGNTVASEHESFPATTTTTTTTITTTITTTASPTTGPTASPTAVAATASSEGDPAEAERRNQDESGDNKRYGLGTWGKHGHCQRRREVIGGVKPAAARWVRWVRNAIQGSLRVSRYRCAPSTSLR